MTVSQSPLLRVAGLGVRYGVATALDDISIEVEQGGFVALLGANGAGKSSLARAISGVVPASAGSIHYAGQDITKLPAHVRRRRGLAYLPEERGVFWDLSVIDNLRMGVRWLPTKADRQEAIAYCFDLFPRLAERRTQLAGSMSGGEQQMLALGRSLAVRPQLLIADELSLGLSPKMVDLVFDVLDKSRNDGTTVVLIEQFVHRALELGDSAVILRQGRVVWTGTAEDAKDEVLVQYLEDSAELESAEG
ncbi:ABC transporter ATP-binding protein [Streptomyces sp. NPDC029041]|uniref:ABC transporter ATP-binding protein n=1 Tax=Streptomyces sp. NPDC029041 TaxID=3155727 RepID=UPI0033CA3E16